MKSFQSIVSQPTVKTGELKTGLAITKLANAQLDVQFDGSITVQGKSLEIGAVIGASLLPAFDNKYDVSLDDLLSLYASGYIINQQRNIAELIANGGQSKKGEILPVGSVLSANDYLANNLKIAELDNIALFATLSKFLINVDKTTKADLVEFVISLHKQLLPESIQVVYEEKLRKETELQAQFAELVTIGFDNIQPIADNRFSATLALTKANALQELTGKGYLLKDSNVDISKAEIKVIFEKVESKTK